ncbi:MAG: 2-dehydropantoate 2-reductase [Oleiphilaceae bacterium]|nr:2-dehydropantoate 2-reductase [Oleiphilaceae bacterium]
MSTIAILGAGAMGSLWAAQLLLNKACDTLFFVDPRPQRLSSIQFQFTPFSTTQATSNQLNVPCVSPKESASPDLLLVCTKSYQALPALTQTLRHWPTPPALLLFQNGMGSQQAILNAWPALKIYAAISTEGAYRPDAHSLVHAGKGETIIGPMSKTAIANGPQTIRARLAPSELSLLEEANIWPRLWRKLVINCAINPFTALCRCKNGEVPQQPLFQQLWPDLRQELQQLLRHAGMMLSAEELEELVFGVIRNTANNRSSMLQDIEAQRPTEIDDINGFAAHTLQQAGLNHQINQQLWESVRALGH